MLLCSGVVVVARAQNVIYYVLFGFLDLFQKVL
jgi:hypothetical protein